MSVPVESLSTAITDIPTSFMAKFRIVGDES